MKFTPIITVFLLSASSSLFAASYEVQEIPLSDIANFHFGVSIDETGTTLSTVRSRFNPEIDLSLYEASRYPLLTDPDAAEAGNFNTTDLSIVANDLINNTIQSAPFLQKIAENTPFISDGTNNSYLNGFDQESDATNGFTFALTNVVTDSVNGTHFTGGMAGPYSIVPYTNANDVDLTYVVNEFFLRGFVQVGEQVTPLIPEYVGAGGFSVAGAINSNLQVGGVQSFTGSETLNNLIDECLDDDVRGDEPVEACLYTLNTTSNSGQAFRTSTSFLYSNILFESAPVNLSEIRPTMWQVDANGEVISSQVYDLLHTPESFNFNMYTRINDINSVGTMVGFTTVPESEREQMVAVATVFENGETIRLFDVEDIVASYAMAINDNDIVVGFFPALFNDRIRNRMFVFDRNDQSLTRPESFFISANTHPRAINNNGLVVGDAESDVFDTNTRSTSGFLYNVADQSFVDLNSLLPCDSPFTIISANDINDSDEIIADALVRRPTRDIRGEVTTGNIAGDSDYVVSVKLVPTGNPPAECEVEDTFNERQGASFQFFWLMFILLAAVLRLRK